jgi:hypothetical protein
MNIIEYYQSIGATSVNINGVRVGAIDNAPSVGKQRYQFYPRENVVIPGDPLKAARLHTYPSVDAVKAAIEAAL